MSYRYKIFFIITHSESYIPCLELSMNDTGFKNLKKVHSEIKTFNNTNYIASVYSFDIIEDKLIKDNETDKYVLNIILKEKKFLLANILYKGKIEFKEIRNHFIYNFKFENLNLYITESNAPTNILILSKIEKIKIFEKILIILGSEPGDILSNDFIEDSIESIIKEKSFDIEYYLELLKYCYTTNKIIKLLKNFNLNNCKISTNFRIEDYSPILDKINSTPEIYTRYLNEIDENIRNNFYDLLLYYKMTYETGKLKILLNKKELWEHFAKKINFKDIFYPLVAYAGEGFIKIIMEQKNLSFGLIKEIIFAYKSFEKMILFIHNYFTKIKEICRKEDNIRMTSSNSQTNIFSNENAKKNFKTPIDKLRTKLENLIKHFKKRKYQFVLFDEKFWDNYFIYDKIKIFLIDESIIICQKVDKKFQEFKDKENNFVSKLSNEELLKFLEYDLRNYEERNYEINYYNIKDLFNNYTEYERNECNIGIFRTYKPLSLFDKIKINNLNEDFFEKWRTNKKKIFNLKDKRYILIPKDIIHKIHSMDDFEKVLKIFYSKDVYNDDNNYQNHYEKELISLFSETFMNLIKNNKNYHNIPQNASFVINLMIKIHENKYNKKIKHLIDLKKYRLFMKELENKIDYIPLSIMELIEKIIADKKIIYEIYILLSSNRISNIIINHMADYIFDNNGISIIKKLNKIQKSLIPMILYKIDKKINECMLYDNEEINIFFKLLNDIEKEKLIQDFLSDKFYLNNIPIILDNIINGEVTFKVFNSIFPYFDNKVDYLRTEEKKIKLFKNKLSILLFNQTNEVKIYMNQITNYLDKIYKEQKYIEETKEILNNYYNYKNDYEENITLLTNALNAIKKSNLNGIYKEPIKSYLNKIHNKFPDFDKKYIINYSLYFIHKLNMNKTGNKDIDETFNQVRKEFDELKILFEKNWELKIIKERIFEYYNIINKEEKNKKGKNLLIKELKILMNYHRLNRSIEELNNIGDKIAIYILKQNALKFLNDDLDLISNESSYNYKQLKEALLKMKNIISYKLENENESLETNNSD